MTLIDDSLTTFRSELPEFASTADAAVRRQLGVALEIYALRPRGVAYLAAHLLTVRNRATSAESNVAVEDGGTRIVISERIGEKSITYQRSAAGFSEDPVNDEQLEQTEYGRTYIMIRDASVMPTIRSL